MCYRDKEGAAGSKKLLALDRYNVELSRQGLDALGLTSIKPEKVMRLDSIEHVPELRAIGHALVRRDLSRKPFESFL
jgi:hypothetical protein